MLGSPVILDVHPQLTKEEEPLGEEPLCSPAEILDTEQTTFITERRHHGMRTFDVYYKDSQDLSNEGLLIAHAARRVGFNGYS